MDLAPSSLSSELESFRFEFPARAEYVGLIRLLVAALAEDRRELDEERLEDLRLAVSEAATLAVGPATAEHRITVVCRESIEALVVTFHDGVTGVAPAVRAALDEPGDLSPRQEAPIALLHALVDEVCVGRVDDADVLVLRMVCPPAAARPLGAPDPD